MSLGRYWRHGPHRTKENGSVALGFTMYFVCWREYMKQKNITGEKPFPYLVGMRDKFVLGRKPEVCSIFSNSKFNLLIDDGRKIERKKVS